MDALIKFLFVFNISSLIFYFFIRGQLRNKTHYMIIGYTIGAVFYIAAGYVHNSFSFHFPARMAFSLFPLIYISVSLFLEERFNGKYLKIVLALFLVVHMIFSITGYIIDNKHWKENNMHIRSIYDIL